ncbi:MAG: UDP-3-O-acyl-N-acetylglucosamine deacetylase [Alphaproteobacteria bacterium]|nr:UDP-3-O-acyl-N-acetylglucosamine deacetylase [Alphaproteobacteria bacterium]MCL2505401.1 UDP-3-O-acyl-N-acetylglucosamine deacetylase [Alphaproteobacteria bacterium]
MQRTIAREIECSGIGVHSGKIVNMKFCPAEADSGIIFLRTDLFNGARKIKALWSNVVDTRMCTVIGNQHGGKVSTVEHLMAAVYACGIDNMLIEINAEEVPIMDGSADCFVEIIESAGTVEQAAKRKVLEILSEVEISDEKNGKKARLLPEDGASYYVGIEFDRSVIGNQAYELELTAAEFKKEVSRARTFGFLEDVENLKKHGLARGGSLENAIIIKENEIMNESGLRYNNEFARHKLLDAIGDIALIGARFKGRFEGHCTGHELNNTLLRAMFEQKDSWRIVEE